MPFVKKSFRVDHEIKAFLYLIREFGLSQGEAQRLIAKGRLLVDGLSVKNSSTMISGEIELVYFEPKSRGVKPIFKTRDFLIYDKPSGVLVHPNTMATEYSMLDEIRTISGDDANGVHRIDMETSGLLLASCHKSSERYLKGIFESRGVKKSYLAWVDGKIDGEFEVDKSIKIRDDYTISKHKVEISPNGRSALTHFSPLRYDEKLDATLVACYPYTGRTHQIRVHLFHVKHPILGDPIYGTDFHSSNDYLEGEISAKDRLMSTGASRLMLHAKSLEFEYKHRYYIESRVDFESMKSLICDRDIRVFNR
ncbi:Putative ribosomal pseudouridine synthase [hydrothermal vent metagenome]|uniref:Putative ribosomal pseudouridine synthase n=1 Tax=hydrothermal vent metagenome TaxID=652676 RepID=A0A1W1BMG8_9ZZZZ